MDIDLSWSTSRMVLGPIRNCTNTHCKILDSAIRLKQSMSSHYVRIVHECHYLLLSHRMPSLWYRKVGLLVNIDSVLKCFRCVPVCTQNSNRSQRATLSIHYHHKEHWPHNPWWGTLNGEVKTQGSVNLENNWAYLNQLELFWGGLSVIQLVRSKKFFFFGVTSWSTVHWLSVPDSSISCTGCASVCCGGKTRNLQSETTPTGKSVSWWHFWWQCRIWLGDPQASQGLLVDGLSPHSPGFPYPLKPRFL